MRKIETWGNNAVLRSKGLEDKQAFASARIEASLDVPSVKFMPAISRVDYGLFIGYRGKNDPRAASIRPRYGPSPFPRVSSNPRRDNSTRAQARQAQADTEHIQSAISKTAG